MMMGFELQRRIAAAGANTRTYVCHPGMSRTDLISGDVTMLNRVLFAVMKPFAQSAERGSWPEVMCATADGLEDATLYGPTKRSNTVGPVGVNEVAPHALDREAAVRLWAVSEEMVGLTWSP